MMEQKDKPKISIVTPSYNQGEFIRDTIESVLDQGYDNLEYIIIDGGSDDNTIDVIKKYEKYLKYWVSEPDTGQSNAINKGLSKSSGDLFNWLNSDDLLHSNALNQIATIYQDNPNSACISGNIQVFGTENWIYNDRIVQSNSKVLTMATAKIKQPSTFYSQSAIGKMGGLNEELHYIMDFEWFLRFLLTHDIDQIIEFDGIFSHFRIHDESKTGSDFDAFERDKASFWESVYSWRNDPNASISFDKVMYDQAIIDECLALINYRKLVMAYKNLSKSDCLKIIDTINFDLLDHSRKAELLKMKNKIKWLPSIIRKR